MMTLSEHHRLFFIFQQGSEGELTDWDKQNDDLQEIHQALTLFFFIFINRKLQHHLFMKNGEVGEYHKCGIWVFFKRATLGKNFTAFKQAVLWLPSNQENFTDFKQAIFTSGPTCHQDDKACELGAHYEHTQRFWCNLFTTQRPTMSTH